MLSPTTIRSLFLSPRFLSQAGFLFTFSPPRHCLSNLGRIRTSAPNFHLRRSTFDKDKSKDKARVPKRPIERFLAKIVMRALVFFLVSSIRTPPPSFASATMDEIYREAYERRLRTPQGSFPQGGARTSPSNPPRPRHQYGYQPHAQQAEGGILQTLGNVLWGLITLIIFFFAAYWAVHALWQWQGRRAWDWIAALPQHPRVQAAKQRVGELPERGFEEIQGRYYRLRYNEFMDQGVQRWNRLKYFIRDYFLLVAAISFVLWVAWKLLPRESEAKFIPLEEAGAYGWEVPEWARLQAERQRRGLNNYGSGGHVDTPYVANSDVAWDEPEPVNKKSPRPGTIGSDPRWEDYAPPQGKQAAETTTITVYERDESPPSIITRSATVFQPTEKTVYLTHTESTIETVHEPTTITVYPEEKDEEISIVTSFEEKTVTIASSEFLPKIVTKWQPTIIANVTPTTVYSIRHTTVTNFETVTIPGTTLTSTILEEPSTITVFNTTGVQPGLEREADAPSYGYLDHDHASRDHDSVRRDVEGAVWCKTCKQYHCCQLPY